MIVETSGTSSALRLFSWEQPEHALSKIQSAGHSIGRVQFSGREFSRGHLSRLLAILERHKHCFSTPTSFLFPGVMLRDDESFNLVCDFLRRWKELHDVQFERAHSCRDPPSTNACACLARRHCLYGSLQAAHCASAPVKKSAQNGCGWISAESMPSSSRASFLASVALGNLISAGTRWASREDWRWRNGSA